MRRHYLDAEEIAALLDTSGRRGEAEEALAPWRVGGSMRRLGLTRKTSMSSEWPDNSLQKYDPLSPVLSAVLLTPRTCWCRVFVCSFLQITAETKGGTLYSRTSKDTITILWFLAWRIPLNGCALCSLELGFYRTFSDRGLRPPWSCNYSKSVYDATRVMLLLFDAAGTCWKYVEPPMQQWSLSSHDYQLGWLITHISLPTKASLFLANLHVLDGR